MAGHVFVVHGDLTALSCDAWLLPGSDDGVPGPTWWHAVSASAAYEPIPKDFGRSDRRVIAWTPMIDGAPRPYLTDVGGSRGTAIEWYLDGAREFFDRVERDLRGKRPRNGRARPLVALPLVGTGQGGKRREAGAVARQLLPMLYEIAERTDLDIALMMIEGPAYSAVQAERMTSFRSRAFASLDPELDEIGRRLAKRTARGQIVLFIGAGVSTAAGLPGWTGLLDELGAGRAGLSAAERKALAELNPLDQARFIEARLGGADIGRAAAEFLESRSTHYALSHGLLAALPIDQVVTTNYDRLFERASAAASRPVTVLPYEHVKEPGHRWLLKMHGCVSHPDDIVLTRDDYLAYHERREALAAIVQALLITRHMLFVGFSLQDDNFHQIVHSVRKAVGGDSFGTSLMVATHPLAASLWEKDIRFVSLDRATTSIPDAARMLEILLDRIGAGSVSATQHLFDPRYDGVLTPGEQRVARALGDLVSAADAEMKDSVAWGEVEAMLARLGWKRS